MAINERETSSAEPPEGRVSAVRHARNSQGEPAESGMVRQLSEFARELRADPDMTALLNHIVHATVNEIDGAVHGGISLIAGVRIRTEAATSSVVGRLDQLQIELGEGPCVSSLREQVTVRSDDFAHERRWPNYVRAARSHGVHSMLSVQLFVEGDNLGALNLYASAPGVFDAHDESTAMALAAHAAVAMKGASTEGNLRIALASRDVIGQGKGILMERYRISANEAFDLLVLASQRTHRKLRDVADHLAATGELPTDSR